MNKKFLLFFLIVIAISLIIFFIFPRSNMRFDGKKAFEFINQQVNFGPRIPGSDSHKQTIELIRHDAPG